MTGTFEVDDDDGIDGSFVLKKNTSNQIESWGLGYKPWEGAKVQWASFTLYSDNYYIYWESRNNGEVEYGTYEYDKKTKYMCG